MGNRSYLFIVCFMFYSGSCSVAFMHLLSSSYDCNRNCRSATSFRQCDAPNILCVSIETNSQSQKANRCFVVFLNVVGIWRDSKGLKANFVLVIHTINEAATYF